MHRRKDHASRQCSGHAAGSRKGEEAAPASVERRRQCAQCRGLERQHEEQCGSAEGAKPGVLHDFQPPFRRGFHEEAVAAVRHAVEMQPAGYEDPDEAPDDPAEQGGQEQGR